MAALAASAPGARASGPQGAAAAPDRDGAQQEPLRIITYTQKHCEELSLRAAELVRGTATIAPEALQLSDEGTRLCAEGRIRPGIVRLRRAILLLRAGAP